MKRKNRSAVTRTPTPPVRRGRKLMTHGEKTRALKRKNRSAVTPTPPPPSVSHCVSLLDLPSHLVEEILFRVPVKSLLQLRSICKRLNSLISNPKFLKNHLGFCCSTNSFQLHILCPLDYRITSYPINSILSTTRLITTSFECPLFNGKKHFSPFIVGSCDGILCIAGDHTDLIFMCNPSIRKINQLPHYLEEKNPRMFWHTVYGFGYDPLSHNYKVVVVIANTQVKIHTLGTHIWRRKADFSFTFLDKSGVSLNGTVNWLASSDKFVDSTCVIVSLDLGNECFQQLPLPNYGTTIPLYLLSLSVHRDCLCLLADHDVWMMKKFGNQSSWTKFITIPYMKHPPHNSYIHTYRIDNLLYISEDDQFVLTVDGLGEKIFDFDSKMVVYDSRNGLVKYHPLKNPPEHLSIESLISA